MQMYIFFIHSFYAWVSISFVKAETAPGSRNRRVESLLGLKVIDVDLINYFAQMNGGPCLLP